MKINQEQERVSAVRRYLEFNHNREKDLQEVVMLASVICETPVALITLIDDEVQLIKARIGIDAEQMPRSTSFCTHAIEIDEVMEVNDATLDSRFANAPAVMNNPHIRFYASANLKSYDGFNVGTLCVYDTKPKKLDDQQLQCLSALANQVSHIMELDRSLKQLKDQNAVLTEIARIQSHEIRQPVASILGAIALIKENGYSDNPEYMQLLEMAVIQLDDRIRMVVTHAQPYPG